MDFDKVLNETVEPENGAVEEFAQTKMKVLIDNTSAFKGRIVKPTVVSFKYKDLMDKIKEKSGVPMTKEKAKAIFAAVREIMGV